MITTHMSLGIVLTLALLVRIIWRLIPGHKVQDAATGLVERAAKAMHYLLYGLLAAQMMLGFATRWTDNQPMAFFGLAIPSPFGTFPRATGWLVDQIHNYTAWAIVILAAGHAAAALAHHFWWRDDVLRRMLPMKTLSK
jgi:cytochrome b561